MSAKPPIVTWSTPVLQMEHTLRKLGEELELGNRDRKHARAIIRAHLGHVRDLIAYLDAEPPPPKNPGDRVQVRPHYVGLDRK